MYKIFNMRYGSMKNKNVNPRCESVCGGGGSY